MADCPMHRSPSALVCLVPGDKLPDGTQWPRCVGCGHRRPYDSENPPSTRSIMKRHPFYLFRELAMRREAIRYADPAYAEARWRERAS